MLKIIRILNHHFIYKILKLTVICFAVTLILLIGIFIGNNLFISFFYLLFFHTIILHFLVRIN